MTTDHNVLEEVLGLERADLTALSRWQLVSLAMECLEAMEVGGTDKGERELHRRALDSLRALRRYYD